MTPSDPQTASSPVFSVDGHVLGHVDDLLEDASAKILIIKYLKKYLEIDGAKMQFV